jgi:hypothetical protein
MAHCAEVHFGQSSGATMKRSHHILGAASNLLGISLLIIAGLHISNRSAQTITDEIAWIAASFLSASCFFSYLSLRGDDDDDRFESIADLIFIIGLILLVLAVLGLGFMKAV